MSRAKICPRCRCYSFGGREALSLWYAAFHHSLAMYRSHSILGGEFSSLYQNTFHHYRDFWCFDITTRSWDRIDTKVRPSARSGHRFDLYCLRSLSPFLSKPYLEWPFGSTTSSSSVDFMIRASPVSVSEPAHSSEVSIAASPSTIYERSLDIRHAGVQVATDRIQGPK